MTDNERTEFSSNKGDVEAAGKDLAAALMELAEVKAKADANLAGWQRSQADFVNFRRRTEQEKEDAIRFANANLALRILPVLDDFERAVASLPSELSGNAWGDGMKHIERKLRTSLESAGLSPIQAMGEPFDPRFHEAITQGKGKEGMIVGELEKGYKFLDRVIRPSKVVVGNGEPDTTGQAGQE
jgi:molecular chaperone GrpE